ncbi:MAG: hypothetical protein GC185_06885 [Alphaproteobacteria bacterium]|nr:hypothetical protein [Alphaproteobacteria bacterium]
MGIWTTILRDEFNDRGKQHESYTITLTRPAPDLAAQAEDFCERLSLWLTKQGEGFKGEAKAPEAAAVSNEGNARVSIQCTERAIALIERQFGTDILKVDPPAQHVRGAIYPPKVDPWDVSKW